MLYLDRREGEAIVIDLPAGKVTVTFVSCRGGRVRLGIDAPPSVVVDRQEVHERKQREARDAV